MSDGCVKLALSDDATKGVRKGDIIGKFELPKSWYGVTEATVVDKVNGRGQYVIIGATQILDTTPCALYIAEEQFVRKSKLFILDGEKMEKPVYSLDLPYVLPYGLHSLYLDWDQLQSVGI
jgi:Retinal pigment epithelial membrane protein